MKKFALALLLFYLFGPSGIAQHTIRLEYKQDMQGNFIFSCTNTGFCNYILGVDFTTMENAKADHALPFLGLVKPGNTKLFKLSKLNAGDPIQFKYNLTYFKGCLDPQIDTGFTYLLPISPGKETQAYESQSGSYAIRLRMKPGDTLFAARRGTVTEQDLSDTLNDAGQSVMGAGNFIEIVHTDCSFARYGVLRRNGSLVKPGQFVEAGDPIGIIGGDKFGRGSEVRFSVCYNRRPDAAHNDPGNNDRSYWNYIALKFWTKKNGKGMLRHGGTYTSEFPESVITQEMSKTELAKRKAKQRPAKGPKPATSH
jgi:hypothetical protein